MPKKIRKRNNVSDNGSHEYALSLDALNVAIIKEMMNNADIRSATLARKYRSPLSTVQRRRTRLERTLLKKKYHMDIARLGWRQADLLISVAKGNCEGLARKLLDTYENNIIATSLRIGDPDINVMAEAYYQSTEELHNLVEGIKGLDGIKSVEWSEVVKIVASDNARMIDRVFGDKARPA
jgi:DNA-binding Lrp family transcriptional regulator